MIKDDISRPEQVEATLALLHTIEEDGAQSQRGIAQRLGVALGLANALVKRCLTKGVIKIQEAPARRFVYYLTPEGFSEKAQLVRDYLKVSLSFFRRARAAYEGIFDPLKSDGKPIALLGGGELAEIAVLSAGALGVPLAAIVIPGSNLKEFHGIPVVPSLDALAEKGIQHLVIADADRPQQSYDDLQCLYADDQIHAPDFLHIRRLVVTPEKVEETAA